MSAEPPLETRGSGTPMMGSMPITEPMLSNAWLRNQTMIPAAARRVKPSSAWVTTRKQE